MNQPPRIERALQACRSLQRNLLAAAARDADQGVRLQQLSVRLERVQEQIAGMSPDYEMEGRELLMTLNQQYPGLWSAVDRELLWFLGGECLHFLSDEEISAFQLQEERAEGRAD